MADIKNLIAEKERMQKEQEKLEKQIQQLQKRAKKELRDKIVKMCQDAGTTVEELFGTKAKRSTRRSTGIPKYIHDGVPYDGRVARGMEEFNKVQVDGKIDDRKALKQKMINPAWLKSNKAAAKQFVRDHKVNLEKY
ncbi:MAG: H-NS histone family protein [Rhodothermales bacterium]|nr:H-NS histone family protein [Rhodothermales bacterium]